MIVTNYPDFLSKIFAKHFLTALTIVMNTLNRNNKHNNNSNVLLGTSALNVKSLVFYNNYGCNTEKIPFFKVHIKNMDLSDFTIGTQCHMARDLILYLIATWPSTNIFSQDKKKDLFKESLISEFLVKIKGVHFSFFYLFQITCDGLFIFAYLNLYNFVVDESSKNLMSNWRSNGLLSLYKNLMWCSYSLCNMFA